MTDMDDPLDFEFEEPINISTSISKKKKKKVIGLDDLLADYYKEKSKVIERESKRAAKYKTAYDSDEDMDEQDARGAKVFHDQVDDFQKKMGQLGDDDDAFLWGFQVFGNQKTLPPVQVAEIKSCELLHSFRNHEVNSLVGLETEKGETFLEGLLTNGWLFKLVSIRGQLERSIATWTFNLMLYSPNEVLRRSAYDFWCDVLQHKDEVDNSSFKIEWVPNYPELKRALEIYGFQLDSYSRLSSDVEMDPADSVSSGPPENILYWIKYVSVCFQLRDMRQTFSISEAEDLIFVILSLFLDRILLGLSMVLHECMIAAVRYFNDDEWQTSSQKIATSLALRLPTDVNCLRIVESISGVDTRSKHLRSSVAFQFLLRCYDKKVLNAEEILELLTSTNVKDKNCDFFKMYIHLSLAENWLLCDRLLKDKPVISEMWVLCLRNISCYISSTDLRSYASKVRCKASYLLQGTSRK